MIYLQQLKLISPESTTVIRDMSDSGDGAAKIQNASDLHQSQFIPIGKFTKALREATVLVRLTFDLGLLTTKN